MTPIKIAGLVCKYKVAMFRPKTGDWMIDAEKEEQLGNNDEVMYATN